ncbi:secretin N-terminal domain-containing protein [Thalassotalea agariperforans]
MKLIKKYIYAPLLTLILLGCSSTSEEVTQNNIQERFKLKHSYLADNQQQIIDQNTEKAQAYVSENQVSSISNDVQMLEPLPRKRVDISESKQLSAMFSNKPSLTLSVNQMDVIDFIHYTFGELLSVNYIIDKDLKSKNQAITLNIKEEISQQRLMELTEDLLAQRGLAVQFSNDLYYIHKPEKKSKGRNVITAIGRELSSVPNTSQDILQIVPLKFGVKISIEKALRQLVGVQISTDADMSALFLEGNRDDIIRSLEFIHLLDAPSNRGKHIALIPLTYIESEEYTKQITTLLENEGIPIATNKAGSKNLVMVPIAQVGAIAVFAADDMLLNRVRFWTKVIDKPLQSVSKQYFMYHPQFARATDLGESVSALLSGAQATNRGTKSSTSKSSTGVAPSANRSIGMSNDDITLVVDERANAIIFYTSGSEYQALLPLIKKLDVLPRQVMLDITIAEVNLKDEFKYGVEWALNSGKLSMGTKGAFNATGIGGFNIAINGTEADITANFLQTNSLIKVLSNPTLLVRDGVPANITVGSQISVIGQTTQDPVSGDRQTTSSEYRKTGVDISVTPSINAQGIVIMEINQSISNTVEDTSGAGGNPDIFERSIDTEVVAQSGQTIILGGLISENINQSDKKSPWLADLPIIGHLFKATGDSSNRTELIMLITPKVIDRTDQWEELTESFKQGLDYLTFGELETNKAPLLNSK